MAAKPPSPSASCKSILKTAFSLAYVTAPSHEPRCPSVRLALNVKSIAPSIREALADKERRAGAPKTLSPRVISRAVRLPISIETGSSGKRNGVASAAGNPLSSTLGKRNNSIFSAANVSTSMRPDKSAARLHISVAFEIRSHVPSKSAISISSIVASLDSAPLKPRIVTSRPSPPKLLSNNPARYPRSSSDVWACSGALNATKIAKKDASSLLFKSHSLKPQPIKTTVQYRCRFGNQMLGAADQVGPQNPHE